MEKINTENIIASLILMDFEFVDVLLYTSTLATISKDEEFRRNFEFQDKEISEDFFDIVGFNGVIFKIKEDCNIPILLEFKLHPNKKLLEYLKSIDFKDVLDNKMKLIRNCNIEDFGYLISNKEREILDNKEVKKEKIKINRK